MDNNSIPIFLKIETVHFLIVGGDNMGLEVTETLLNQNTTTRITIVSPYFHPKLIETIQQHENISFFERAFQKEDLDYKNFIIITTNKPQINSEIIALANEKGIKVNVPNEPTLSQFYIDTKITSENFANIPKKIFSNPSSKKYKKLKNSKKYKQLAFTLAISFSMFFVGYGLSTIVSISDVKYGLSHIPNEFYGMLLIGFFAQLVDGAVGLGYGVTCATSMMLLGINLPAISGSIHTAEMFSSGVSGYSHYKFGNVNKKLLFWLAIPGVFGAVFGAMLLIYLGNKYVKFAYIALSVYTMIIGIRLIILAYRKIKEKKEINNIGFLGFSGGFLDAFGGGGWGPIVTSTLLAKGRKSNYVVGTVSLAEFFVTLAAAITFFVSLGVSHWYIIVGLILGGIIAAPIAAKLAGKLPQKTALLLVAALVIIFSVRVLLKVF